MDIFASAVSFLFMRDNYLLKYTRYIYIYIFVIIRDTSVDNKRYITILIEHIFVFLEVRTLLPYVYFVYDEGGKCIVCLDRKAWSCEIF